MPRPTSFKPSTEEVLLERRRRTFYLAHTRTHARARARTIASTYTSDCFFRALPSRETSFVLDSIEDSPRIYCAACCFRLAVFVNELIYYGPIISALPAHYTPSLPVRARLRGGDYNSRPFGEAEQNDVRTAF